MAFCWILSYLGPEKAAVDFEIHFFIIFHEIMGSLSLSKNRLCGGCSKMIFFCKAQRSSTNISTKKFMKIPSKNQLIFLKLFPLLENRSAINQLPKTSHFKPHKSIKFISIFNFDTTKFQYRKKLIYCVKNLIKINLKFSMCSNQRD